MQSATRIIMALALTACQATLAKQTSSTAGPSAPKTTSAEPEPSAPSPSSPTPSGPLSGAGCSETPASISTNERAPYALALIGRDIYWTTAVDGVSTIRVKRETAEAASSLPARSKQIGALAVRGMNLVWAERGLSAADHGDIIQYAVPTGNETTLASGTANNLVDEYSIAADDTDIFWLTHDPASLTQRVWALRDAQGDPVLLGEVTLAVDQNVTRIVADGTWLYWATASGWMYRVSKLGGEPELVADDVNGIGGFDVREGRVVYSSLSSSPSLFSLIPGAAPNELVGGVRARLALQISGDDVFFGGDTGLFIVSSSGGQPQLLASSESIGSVAVMRDALVWTEVEENGSVRGMCRPSTPVTLECPRPGRAMRHACASVSWVAGPEVSTSNQLRIKIWPPAAGPNGPYTDIPGTLTVTPWMPAHGHGTTPPTITKDAIGLYTISDINLSMAGLWEIRHVFTEGSAITDELTISAEIR